MSSKEGTVLWSHVRFGTAWWLSSLMILGTGGFWLLVGGIGRAAVRAPSELATVTGPGVTLRPAR